MTAGCVHSDDATRLPRDQQQTSHQEGEQATGLESGEKPELQPEFHPGGQGGDGVFFGVVADEGLGAWGAGGREGARERTVRGKVALEDGGATKER